VKATAGITPTHNPSDETHWASGLRENLTSRSYGEGLETGRATTQAPRQSLTRQVDNFYVKQHLGLADFRVQSYEATEKWFAIVFVALAFLQWRVNHAQAGEHVRSVADVVRHHRYEHARTLLETACQEAAKLTDYLPVFRRFLCQPT
jgi:hypothetical protein